MNKKRAKTQAELQAADAEKFLALAKRKALLGLKESEAEIALPLEHPEFVALAQKLEEEGRLRILSFSPLVVVGREAVDRLGQKLLGIIAKFHETHPKEKGIVFDKLKARFEAPRKILLLALKSLIHEGKLKEEGRTYALAGFSRELPLREETLLARLEKMCFEGDFRTVTLQDLREAFRLTPRKLEQLLDILVERERIVQNKDGFFLHRRWLDDLIGRVRGLGKRELSVAEFKALTGLSRKYAIPLLELLDEMGVTRRRGAARDIL
jgi:selenocysteine-specific elongation factor